MSNLRPLFLIVVATIVFTSCDFSFLTPTNGGSGVGTTSSSPSPTPPPADVYLAGTAQNFGNHKFGGYWINGVWTKLSQAVTGQDTTADSIYVYGSDVYVGGSRLTTLSPDVWEPGYWKNDTWVSLPVADDPTKPRTVASIQVVGNDVYAVSMGTGTTVPTGYWKNGTWVDLPLLAGSTGGSCRDLSVDGTDVYVVGQCYFSGTPTEQGVYWKNGVAIALQHSDPNDIVQALSVFAYGGNVYTSGYSSQTQQPLYWDNNAQHILYCPIAPGETASIGGGFSITVNNGSIYVAGVVDGLPSGGGQQYHVGYWKNESYVQLIPNQPVNMYAIATDVALKASYPFFCGTVDSGTGDHATYWIGTTAYDVHPSSSFVSSGAAAIFVK